MRSKPTSDLSQHLVAASAEVKLRCKEGERLDDNHKIKRYGIILQKISWNRITANILKWLAHNFRVFSRRISTRIFLESLCFRNFTSPVPRSFHCLRSGSNRNSFARLKISEWDRKHKKGWRELNTYCLYRTSSSSSIVLIFSTGFNFRTGANCKKKLAHKCQ